jgi:hypothetical protein
MVVDEFGGLYWYEPEYPASVAWFDICSRSSWCDGEPQAPQRATIRILKRAESQPVDWFPWGALAFRRAEELNRPVLLDVGAAWCPWCNPPMRDFLGRWASQSARGRGDFAVPTEPMDSVIVVQHQEESSQNRHWGQ